MTNQTSTQLSTFNFENSAIRVIAVNGEPWFVAKDVCDAIGIDNNRKALLALDDDEKGVTLSNTLGGQQEMNIISESGMYTLILRCREAVKKGSVPHRFRKWVTAEVLPQIRKTGQYSQNNQQIAPLAPPPKKYTFEFTEDELLDLAWAWFAFIRGIHTFRHIYSAFEKLGSNMSGNIYGQGFEYATTARNAHKVINRLTKDFQYDYDSNWRVLKHIRSFEPTFKQPTF
ncbi:P22AR C-terminal domain-containing protein [Mannheimia haemolytica]|uniref:P22AR C-terminal domain-containing protein n=1 Tax=Mannheimia haemolytica TaxID=75985 RepID=UPI001ADCF5D3|nr:Bro-N domain-containing protein [Mannheimia haemolytica]